MRFTLRGASSSTISQETLHEQGYPRRPDPAQAALYNTWLQIVSNPNNTYELTPIAQLGGAKGGSSCSCSSSGNPGWTGFIQAAAGFGSGCLINTPISNSQLYLGYQAGTTVPFSTCSQGPCETYLWAGIGGYANANDSSGSNHVMQHGFMALGTNDVEFYWEFPSGPGHTPLIPGFSMGDDVVLEAAGVSADSCSSSFDGNAPYACFLWYDPTQNYSAGIVVQGISGGYQAASVEYIAEAPATPGLGNANFGTLHWQGYGVDWNGNAHLDQVAQR